MSLRETRRVLANLALLFCLGGSAGVARAEFQAADMHPHPSAAAAFKDFLQQVAKDGKPIVLALGEYHETNADARKKQKGVEIPSALRRFSSELLPLLAPESSDLVLETWITDGSCGKKESAAVKDVQTTTQRPETTEDELVTLVKQAKAAGVVPHILKLSCDDYQSLLAGGEVDYDKLLRLITELLQKKTLEVKKRREKDGVKKHVLIYGGALHNDLSPKPELAAYSFGPSLKAELGDSYVELDLYVPEFIARDKELQKEPFVAYYKKHAKPGQSVLYRRGPGSYVLFFAPGGKK